MAQQQQATWRTMRTSMSIDGPRVCYSPKPTIRGDPLILVLYILSEPLPLSSTKVLGRLCARYGGILAGEF